ncbi:purine-cytosine permease family protein [Falsibacillus albus]|uniref:Cytosine permease n=1 Tax=Falsibacillus albus TaxID=2478915 RepID=A0A3L7K4D4_9BACI|nr:cytosine permease [Falsibacillus albus]RLQ97946.1 cytosine permease [Falsibacillus albus]
MTTAKMNRIERLGLQPVPTELKNTRWFEYFIIQLSFSVNAGNFIVPALAVLDGNLPWEWAIVSTLLGAAAAFLFVSILSIPGSRYGLPAQYAIRSLLGTKLARYFASPVRSITSLYWFSVQTIGGTMVIVDLSEEFFHIHLLSLPISIILAILMTILALVGFDAVKKFTKWCMPLLILGQIVMGYLFIHELNSHFITNASNGNFTFGSFFLFASLAFVQYVSGVSASSDITRYAENVRQGFWGLFSGNVVGFFITALFGSLSAHLTNNLNPFVSSSHLANSAWMTFILTLCAMISMVSINLSNAYTGGFSLLNAIPRVGRINSSLLFGAAAILLSCFPAIIENAKDYISLLGAFIIPISAIIVAEFMFLKRLKLSVQDLERIADHSFSYNSTALLIIIVNSILYFLIPGSLSPGFIVFAAAFMMYLFASAVTKKSVVRASINKS